MEKIKVVIADDHPIFRDGLKTQLNNSNEITVIAEANTGFELVKLVKIHQPDVVLTDLIMPGSNGIEAIKEIYLSGIKRIIAISTYDTNQLIIDALQAGAMGYIVKNAPRGEIVEAIKTVYNYEKYFCKFTSSKLLKTVSKISFHSDTKEKKKLFTEKEKKVIRLICQEKSSEEIGEILFMGRRTVEGLRSRIKLKMKVKSIQGMVIYAIKNKIFPLNTSEDPAQPE